MAAHPWNMQPKQVLVAGWRRRWALVARVMMTGRGSVRDASQEKLLGPPATMHHLLGVYKST